MDIIIFSLKVHFLDSYIGRHVDYSYWLTNLHVCPDKALFTKGVLKTALSSVFERLRFEINVREEQQQLISIILKKQNV
jgi:hypothetical protein